MSNVLHGWSRGKNILNEQQNNASNPEKQCSCMLSGSSENRAFERYRSAVSLLVDCPDYLSLIKIYTENSQEVPLNLWGGGHTEESELPTAQFSTPEPLGFEYVSHAQKGRTLELGMYC